MTGIGLSPAELEAVETTWGLVRQDLKGHGAEIFLRLFKSFPEYQDLFSKFRGKTLEEVGKSAQLRAHGTVFMHGLAGFMDCLQDTESLVCLIEANVERHFVRGIRTEQFINTLDLMPGYLTEKLDHHMTPNATQGWIKVLDAIKSTSQTKIQEMEAEISQN